MIEFLQDAFSTLIMFLTSRDSYEKYLETQTKILDLKPSWARFLISLLAQNHLKRRSLAKRIQSGTVRGMWWGPDVSSMSEQQIVGGNAPVMLFIHGGAFTVGHTKLWAQWCADITTYYKRKHNKDFRIFAVDYTLAPDAHFPTQHTQCLAALDYLIRRCGIDPARIIISGDSAGGNLALQTMYEYEKISSLGGAILFSPWVYPTVSLHLANVVKSPTPLDIKKDDSYYLFSKTDYVTDNFAVEGVKAYLGPNISYTNAFSHKGVNPILRKPEEAKDFPSTFVVYGGSEKLRDQVLSWIENNKETVKDLETFKEPEGVHDWPLSPKLCKDAATYERGLEAVSFWIQKKIRSGQM